MSEERYKKGLNLLKKLDPKVFDMLFKEFEEFAPEYPKYIVEHVMGDIFSRPTLDLKQRELIALSVLTATGKTAHVEFHVRFALNVGLKKEEIIETIMQTTVHTGFPNATVALTIANKVFEELDV